ncbi:unnamed protein product [Heterobilharzia americana]|nr:unnamed protein product [Heterobilharzia americana]
MTRIADKWENLSVADRILTEEGMCLTNDELEELNNSITNHDGNTKSKLLELGEPLDLHLPFLLPEDCYPSDNPIPTVGQKDETTVSYDDSGICSRSSSTKDKNHSSAENVSTAVITVESIKYFLNPAIQIGWCRLSVKPNVVRVDNTSLSVDESVSDKRMSVSQNSSQFLRWNVYLVDPKLSVDYESIKDDTVKSDERVTISVNCSTDGVQCKNETQTDKVVPNPINHDNTTTNNNIESVQNQSSPMPIPTCDSLLDQSCSGHCTYSVVVPKIGQSLGLSIVAARSEYGQDLGIYVRGINPEGGASHAKLLQKDGRIDLFKSNGFLLTPPYLQIGDRLISVNGQLITGLSQDAAVQLVSSATCEVVLTVIRYARCDGDVDNNSRGALLQSPSLRTNDLKHKESNLQCIDCLLHESLLMNYKAFMDDDKQFNICVNQDSAQKSFDHSGNMNSNHVDVKPTITNNNTSLISSSSTTLKQFSLSSNKQSYDVHSDMKSSLDANYSMDDRIKWKYQSNTNLPIKSTLFCKDPSTSTNEQQFRLYIDASCCNSNTNIYDEPSISDYSLCAESLLSNSKLRNSRVRTLSPNIVGNQGHFEQNTFPARPCHRPKGQSASFDDRLTTPQRSRPPEPMPSTLSNDNKSANHRDILSPRLLINSSSTFSPRSITLSVSPNQSFSSTMDPISPGEFIHPLHMSSTHKSELSCSESCNICSELDARMKQSRSNSISSINPYHKHHCTSSTTTTPNQTSLASHSTVSGGSRPPKTFVPTAYVLPVTSRSPLYGAPTTVKARNSKGCLDSQSTNSRASRSMNDLVTKSSFTDTHQSTTNDVVSNTMNRHTGCSIRRRYTTFTTSRFNIGPRPEPLNRSLVKQTQFT